MGAAGEGGSCTLTESFICNKRTSQSSDWLAWLSKNAQGAGGSSPCRVWAEPTFLVPQHFQESTASTGGARFAALTDKNEVFRQADKPVFGLACFRYSAPLSTSGRGMAFMVTMSMESRKLPHIEYLAHSTAYSHAAFGGGKPEDGNILYTAQHCFQKGFRAEEFFKGKEFR